MAKTLSEILQTYFGCKVPFRKDGEFTTTGIEAYKKLEDLLNDLEGLGVIDSASDAVRVLDEITHENGDDKSPQLLTFDELTNALQYWGPDKSPMKMTIEAVRDECREYIKDSGWECIDDCFDADREVADYIEEHHPDWDTSAFEWSSVNYSTLDFYCDDGYGDICNGDVNILFYGDWNKQIGVFNVTD